MAKRKLLSVTTALGFIVRLLVLTGEKVGTCRPDLSIDVSDSIRFSFMLCKNLTSTEKKINSSTEILVETKMEKKWREKNKMRRCLQVIP